MCFFIVHTLLHIHSIANIFKQHLHDSKQFKISLIFRNKIHPFLLTMRGHGDMAKIVRDADSIILSNGRDIYVLSSHPQLACMYYTLSMFVYVKGIIFIYSIRFSNQLVIHNIYPGPSVPYTYHIICSIYTIYTCTYMHRIYRYNGQKAQQLSDPSLRRCCTIHVHLIESTHLICT